MFSGVTVDGEGNLLLILDASGMLRREGRGGGAFRSGMGGGMESSAKGRGSKGGDESRPVRILYADDSLSVRKTAEKFLTSLGCELTLAVDGAEAMQKLREGEFDMVFTDLEMPRMHGFDLVRELRYVPAYQSLPIVVVTSRSGTKHRKQAASLGATDYVTKPFTEIVLKDMITRWTGAQDNKGKLRLVRKAGQESRR